MDHKRLLTQSISLQTKSALSNKDENSNEWFTELGTGFTELGTGYPFTYLELGTELGTGYSITYFTFLKANKIQDILIQVNLSEENTKSGVSIKDVHRLIKEISLLDNLTIKGLMTMPPFFNNPEKARPYFSTLRNLRDQIGREPLPNVRLNELSMGMTGDFEVAIEEGATIVRIGTAIFGNRK